MNQGTVWQVAINSGEPRISRNSLTFMSSWQPDCRLWQSVTYAIRGYRKFKRMLPGFKH